MTPFKRYWGRIGTFFVLASTNYRYLSLILDCSVAIFCSFDSTSATNVAMNPRYQWKHPKLCLWTLGRALIIVQFVRKMTSKRLKRVKRLPYPGVWRLQAPVCSSLLSRGIGCRLLRRPKRFDHSTISLWCQFWSLRVVLGNRKRWQRFGMCLRGPVSAALVTLVIVVLRLLWLLTYVIPFMFDGFDWEDVQVLSPHCRSQCARYMFRTLT